jgi:DNA-binding transcriptional ArsR family regulator
VEEKTAQAKAETDADCCNVIHQETVDLVKKVELPEEQVTELTAIFQALGDTTRVRIIHALVQSEMCVCDLAAALGMTQSAISHQLRTLRNLRVIKRRKVGRVAYYSIDDHHILTLFNTGLEHVSHR